jgi:hypothetical protein
VHGLPSGGGRSVQHSDRQQLPGGVPSGRDDLPQGLMGLVEIASHRAEPVIQSVEFPQTVTVLQ